MCNLRGGSIVDARNIVSAVATLFGTVDVWRRLYEPLERGVHAIHPLELQIGVEAGLATPALAERVGQWAAEHTQRQVLAMLAGDHDVHWSCTSLRKVLASLSAGMATHRHLAQVEHVVHWLDQARASKGRYRPTLSVGRDGIFVPLQHKVWQEGATATVSVLDRRGKRLGTVYLGHMPEAGQGTLTTQLTALLKAILSQVDSAGLRLVYVTDDGYHPSDYYHSVLQNDARPAPSLALPGVETDYRLLPCVPVRAAAGRRHLWSRHRESVLGEADAGAVENEGRGGRSGLTVGGDVAAQARPVGARLRSMSTPMRI